MGSVLPSLTSTEFQQQLVDFGLPEPLDSTVFEALHQHYEELCRWNPRLSLVGPSSAEDGVARHYGEALAALPLIRESDQILMDVGTGGGFPGFVIAAARPQLQVHLIEPRQKKWAFLRTAVRKSGLSCQCLNARIDVPLSEGIPAAADLVTCRALALPPTAIVELHKLSPKARFLFWSGTSLPHLPEGFRVQREIALPMSDNRRIVEILGPENGTESTSRIH